MRLLHPRIVSCRQDNGRRYVTRRSGPTVIPSRRPAGSRTAGTARVKDHTSRAACNKVGSMERLAASGPSATSLENRLISRTISSGVLVMRNSSDISKARRRYLSVSRTARTASRRASGVGVFVLRSIPTSDHPMRMFTSALSSVSPAHTNGCQSSCLG
jgi:hypothetical protein